MIDESPAITRAGDLLGKLRVQIARALVGQSATVDQTMIALLVAGHVLIEGVPGLGKTLLVRALAQAVSLKVARIQFTPDLMPSDITGHAVLDPDTHAMRVVRGPVFTNILLADEINRAPAKTQSALLEVMQEHQVSLEGESLLLPRPFMVLATQNPLDTEGTYPLPEAQLDRFMLKVLFSYPTDAELVEIVVQTNTDTDTTAAIDAVASAEQLLAMGALAREVPAAPEVLEYIGRLVLALQPVPAAPAIVREYVRLGPSPRAAQALSLAGRITALLEGRHNLSVEDVRSVAMPALRHRLVLNFDAEREAVTPEAIIADVLDAIGD